MLNSRKLWWRDHRGLAFTLVAALFFIAIELRLFSLQVINRPDFIKLAATNRVRAEVIEPVRGRIYDRNGVLLVENRPSYTLYAVPWIVKKSEYVIDTLALTLNSEPEWIRKRIGSRGWFTFYPAALQRDVPLQTLAYLEARQLDTPGISFRLESKRNYLHPEAVHLLGYVGVRTEEESKKAGGRYGFIGKRGLERVYENYLSGVPGIRYNQVDANGRIIGEVTDPQPIPAQRGWDLKLNLDIELQKYADLLMEQHNGAVVALDPRDGSVLVLLSRPDYDPMLFAGVMPPEVWEELQADTSHPLLNRAIQGMYPPGSTFKMGVLAGAFSEDILDDNTKVTCRGGLQLGRRFFKCWRSGGHGTLMPLEALQKSCDVFFYTQGLALGAGNLEKYARALGFGSRTGIDLDAEVAGLAPGTAYLDRKYGKNGWTRGQLANIAIGQGDVLATPVQLAVYTAAVATGKLVTPRIMAEAINPVSGATEASVPIVKPVPIKEEVLVKLREAMRMVVNEPGGTAYWLRRPGLVIAGKTGTSQNPHGEDHALFVAYAPFDDPQIAIAVVVEHGEHGSTGAAPIAVKLIEKYLNYTYQPVATQDVTAQPDTTSMENLE